MATRYSPAIVTSGLVLCLDAANKVSYPGTGTSWYNLSDTIKTGTLTNGPTFNGVNLGTFVFDGADDYVALPTSGLAFGTGQFTIEAWVYSTSATTYNIIYCTQSSNVSGFISLYYQNTYGFSIGDYNGSVRVTTTHQTVVSQNTWYHVIGLRNSSNQYVVYVNTVASTINNTSTLSITTADPRIGINPATNGERWGGRISAVKLYNRALSTSEILQNYNATKSRFGL